MLKYLTPFIALMLVGAGCTAQPAINQAPTSTGASTENSSLMTREIQDGQLRGVYITPTGQSGKLPGVLVIHEWWGLNDQIKDEARKLAAEGYAVFAIDLYNGEVATSSARAGELAAGVRGNPDAAVAKMLSALNFMASQPDVDSSKLASFGWCFGGGMSAQIGATGDERLKATVIYYGTPITDQTQLARMKQPVLGVWGQEDQSIPVTQVRAFEDALKKQKTPVEFHYYEGAGHAFANPTRGDAYRPEATADAWQKTLDFLARNLKNAR